MRAIYGQASELPASLFDLGISPYINASILVTILLLLPKDLIEWQPLDRLREARKEGKSVRRGRRAGRPRRLLDEGLLHTRVHRSWTRPAA
jgi:hypothetical protein